MVHSLITVTRKMVLENPEEAHKRCARYHALIRRDNWSDDRGNLSYTRYAKGSTLFWFVVLNGELIESGWEPRDNACSSFCHESEECCVTPDGKCIGV